MVKYHDGIMVTLTLWRADKQPGRSTFGPLTSWAATQRHAHDYTESANFGGPVLYRAIVAVPASKILDLRQAFTPGWRPSEWTSMITLASCFTTCCVRLESHRCFKPKDMAGSPSMRAEIPTRPGMSICTSASHESPRHNDPAHDRDVAVWMGPLERRRNRWHISTSAWAVRTPGIRTRRSPQLSPPPSIRRRADCCAG